jgi:hypothetical protein
METKRNEQAIRMGETEERRAGEEEYTRINSP